VESDDWKRITGEPAQTHPPSAQDYAVAGLPWFDLYGSGQSPLPGGAALRQVKSLAKVFEEKTGAALPGSKDVVTGPPQMLRSRERLSRPVRSVSLQE
jgi:hypothetical protein